MIICNPYHCENKTHIIIIIIIIPKNTCQCLKWPLLPHCWNTLGSLHKSHKP